MNNLSREVRVSRQNWFQKCFRGDGERVSLGSTDEMLGSVKGGGAIFCRILSRARSRDELKALFVVRRDYGLKFWEGNLEGAERVPSELVVVVYYQY